MQITVEIPREGRKHDKFILFIELFLSVLKNGENVFFIPKERQLATFHEDVENELFGKVQNSIKRVGEKRLLNVRSTEEIRKRYLLLDENRNLQFNIRIEIKKESEKQLFSKEEVTKVKNREENNYVLEYKKNKMENEIKNSSAHIYYFNSKMNAQNTNIEQ